MRMVRKSSLEATLVAEDGRELADLVAVEADEAGFAALMERLGRLVAPERLPRIAVSYTEGLLGEVRADIPCEVALIEDDRHDAPPVTVRRRSVAEGDSAAVDLALGLAERRMRAGARR